MTVDALAEQVAADSGLVRDDEVWYVAETPTGLVFRDDTPIEVWSSLVTRLLAQHKRIEWAIADAINFGDRCYGEVYSQWVEETGLAKKTLANIAWVGRQIESSRRREDMDFSYHAEVASLPPAEQDALLDRAADQGMTRYELREASRARKEEIRGRTTAEPTEAPSDGPWTPLATDLTPEALAGLRSRLAGIGKRHALGFESGWVAALAWAENRDCFTEWKD
jgi:hypothetical protein